MTLNHTPGPWKAIGTDVYGPTGTLIVKDCASENDARLIAAAPTMLQALRAMVAAPRIGQGAIMRAHRKGNEALWKAGTTWCDHE